MMTTQRYVQAKSWMLMKQTPALLIDFRDFKIQEKVIQL